MFVCLLVIGVFYVCVLLIYMKHTLIFVLKIDREWDYKGCCDSPFSLFPLFLPLLMLLWLSFSFSLFLSSWENSKGSEGSRWSYVWRHPLSPSTHSGISTWHSCRTNLFKLYTPYLKAPSLCVLFFCEDSILLSLFVAQNWGESYVVLYYIGL